MDSSSILYSKGKNDECYTPSYAVEPLLKYVNKLEINLSRKLKIWCPFDLENSNFVKIFKENSYEVIYSHIFEGKDFYKYAPKSWDVIISNPPFTGKRKIFERVLSFNKPFALLMSLTWLNDSAPKNLFMNKDLQLLMFDKRIEYLTGNNIKNKITFSSAYYCFDFLPKQIIMEKLNKVKKD